MPRPRLALDSRVMLLKKANGKGDANAPLLKGLRLVYSGEVERGLRALAEARSLGSDSAKLYLARRADYLRLFGSGGDASEAEPVAKKDPAVGAPTEEEATPESPATSGPDLDPQVLSQMVYDNRRKLFVSASGDVGFYNGRVDVIYDFNSGNKTLNKKDWEIASRKVYASSERQAVVLEGSGSLFHKAVWTSDFILEISFSYTGTLVRASELSLVIVDQKKPEQFTGLFGQQLTHRRKGRALRREGLARVNPLKLGPKTRHSLVIAYKDGEVLLKLNGEQYAVLKGLGVARGRMGLSWKKMSINLHSARFSGYPDAQWVIDTLEALEEQEKGKSGRRR
jgi:hypothetical protein